MKKLHVSFLFFAVHGFVALAQQPQTPFEMAMVLERNLASGIGILMPDPEMPFVSYHGVLPLPGPAPAGFPQGFLNGLVSMQQFGVTVYPVTLCVDDNTGVTAFYNADQVPFWTETPDGSYYANWLLQLHGNVPSQTAELLKPSHVEARWVFVEEGDIPAFHAGWLAHLPPPTPPPSANVPVLNVTAFVPAADTFHFASAWNTTAFFPASLMDVFFTTDLSAPDWSVVKTVPVAAAGPGTAFFEVPRAALPPSTPPPSAHDPNCLPVTNIVVSPLDSAVSYTNVTCDCSLPAQKPSGFFCLGIRELGSGIPPAWWRVLYGFSPFDSWEDDVDFNGDGNTNREKYGLGLNPIAPPGGGAGAAVLYTYDVDDRLTHTFPGPSGAAAVRNLSPVGNPNVQQERNAP
ncbi:MAG: hypothetical protein FWH21_00730 [Kiritimatiellaeota bacterium]|nr:hypothetical protein [Kiritimatiellota bacterium]